MRQAIRSIAATAIVALGCAPRTQSSGPQAGNYPRQSVRLIEGRHDLPVPTEGTLADAFPTLLMLDNAQSFAAQSEAGRISGKYRVEGDSLIFEQYKAGTHWPVYTGHQFGDTIVVRWLTAAGDEPVPTTTAVQFAFVLKRTRQTRSGI
jgi:hypothetical protein